MRLISISRILDAPIGDVWAVTSSFGAARAWMPAVTRVSLLGAGVGAERTVVTSMGTVVERLLELNAERHRVRYSVSGAGFNMIEGFTGGTELTEVSPDRTKIVWSAEAEAISGDTAPLIAVLSGFIEDSIAGLARFLAVSLE